MEDERNRKLAEKKKAQAKARKQRLKEKKAIEKQKEEEKIKKEQEGRERNWFQNLSDREKVRKYLISIKGRLHMRFCTLQLSSWCMK